LTSALIDRLVETLNDSGVVYCHWKSNFSLIQALNGEIDLDLLVDRKSLSQATIVLLNLGFKPAVVKWGPDTPTVSHYYGFDLQIYELIHVHLFCNVLTGESFVKSHLLPFEAMLLENTYSIRKVKVPSKSAELALFTLRMFIKYGSMLDIIYLYRHLEEVKAELNWLLSGSSQPEAVGLLKQYCPVIDELLFTRCINTLKGPCSLAEKILLAHRVRRCLGLYKKYTSLRQGLTYAQLLLGQLQRRLRGNKKNKILDAGGAVIAFVGPEATGKSTLVAETKRWLSQVFSVAAVHAGKPPSAWLTLPLNLVLPLMRSRLPRWRTSRLEGHGSATRPNRSQSKVEGLSSLIYALRAVTLAWDRRRLLRQVRRAAANGDIVICDRYPSEGVGAMDSPRLQENSSKGGLVLAIYNWLARLEGRLYQHMSPPDVVLRLSVSIETAKKRNHERIKPGKETNAYV
jgi:thymidylate kinase